MGLDLGLSMALFLILIFSNFAGSSLSDSSFNDLNLNDDDLSTYCCNFPQSPGSEGTGMTSDGLPAPEEPAYLVLPGIIQHDNTGKRAHDSKYGKQDNRVRTIKWNDSQCLATSTSKISTELSHQFTLVGAKPSGTS